jgi:hypothetical protein
MNNFLIKALTAQLDLLGSVVPVLNDEPKVFLYRVEHLQRHHKALLAINVRQLDLA